MSGCSSWPGSWHTHFWLFSLARRFAREEQESCVGTAKPEDMNPILTADDHAFVHANGYLVVKNVVPKASCDAVIKDIYAFLKMSPGRI